MDEIQAARINATITELRAQRDYFADRCAHLAQEIAELNQKLKPKDESGTKEEGGQCST